MNAGETAGGLPNPADYRRHYRFTSAEYEAMIAAGILGKYHKVELIDGYVLELEPYTYELDTVANLAMELFFDLARREYAGMIKATLHVGEGFVPDPDYWLTRRGDRLRFPQTEDILLVLEVAAESLRFDLEVKTGLYARAGVAELWVIDLPRRVLHRFTGPAPDGYQVHTVLTEDEELTPIKVPGKTLRVRDLLDG